MGWISLAILIPSLSLLAIVKHSAAQESDLAGIGNKFRNKIVDLFGQQSENDLVYVLDSSTSVTMEDYNKAKEFIKRISTLISISSTETRVTLLTYSYCHEIHVHFDYIREPLGGNQCSLPNDVDSVRYISGSTCTSKGIEKAGEILDNPNRRPNAARFVILLTDGRSNNKYNTAAKSRRVKEKGIVILCIGLGEKVNRDELENTATSPDYVFLLENIGDISTLGAIVKGDVSDKNATFDILADSSQCGQCDPHAACTCATKSGTVGCGCAPGFYGNGSHCSACTLGFYKSSYSNADCTKCPDHSTTISIQTTSISNCSCLSGYEGNPESGNDCQPIQCGDIAPVDIRGLIQIPCSIDNALTSVCQFQCENNYREIGGASNITCLATRLWSDSPLQCQKITCIAPPQPTDGSLNCSTIDFDVGTTCSFVCDVGYELEAEENSVITCEKNDRNAMWAGTEGVCRKRTCPPLTKKDPLRIEPSIECQTTPEFNQTCSFGCKDGYGFFGSQISRVCQADGSWSSHTPNATMYCIDIEAPHISPLGNIIGLTDPHKPTASIQWSHPNAADNSGIPVNVNSSHTTISNFPIGETTVTISATDSAGLTSSSNFTIIISDEEKPRILNCPSDIIVYTKETKRNVTWKNDLEFIDNSGNVTIRPELPSTDNVTAEVKRGRNTIQYTGSDPSGNENVCKFNVIVKVYQCQYYPAPLNGAVACLPPTSGNQYCSVTCNQRYQFNGPSEETYNCRMINGSGEWIWDVGGDGSEGTLWPDCTESQTIDQAELKSSFHFYRGQCRKHLGDTSQIKTKLIALLKTLNFCQVDANCNITNVIIDCGNSTRSRRQVGNQGNSLTVLFTTVVTPRDNGTNGGAGQESISVSRKVRELTQAFGSSLSEKIAVENLTIEIDGETFEANPDSVDVDENARAICASGHVILNDTCLSCTPGTFMNERAGICQKCQPGDYQDEFAQVACKACPTGTSSDSPGSRAEEDCRG